MLAGCLAGVPPGKRPPAPEKMGLACSSVTAPQPLSRRLARHKEEPAHCHSQHSCCLPPAKDISSPETSFTAHGGSALLALPLRLCSLPESVSIQPHLSPLFSATFPACPDVSTGRIWPLKPLTPSDAKAPYVSSWELKDHNFGI